MQKRLRESDRRILYQEGRWKKLGQRPQLVHARKWVRHDARSDNIQERNYGSSDIEPVDRHNATDILTTVGVLSKLVNVGNSNSLQCWLARMTFILVNKGEVSFTSKNNFRIEY